ncbi:MAG: DUF6089 family protein [Bernardetiaceae bacterium]
MNYRFLCVLLGWLLSLPLVSTGQRFEPGAGIGLLGYTGDVAPTPSPNAMSVGLEVFLRYNFSPALTVRGNFLLGFTKGDDAQSLDPMQNVRDVRFSTTFLEPSLRLEYNFRDFRSRTESRRLSPYLFGGLGLSWISVDGNFVDHNEPMTPVIPFGVGFKLAMSYNVNLGLELGARKVFSDRIDGLDPDLLTTKFQSVNPYTNDMYYFISFSVSYTYDVGGICPIRFR